MERRLSLKDFKQGTMHEIVYKQTSRSPIGARMAIRSRLIRVDAKARRPPLEAGIYSIVKYSLARLGMAALMGYALSAL
jgi:hypothetical protein